MSSQTEVTGRYVVGFLAVAEQINPMFERNMREVLERNGIENPVEDEWYPATSFWDAINETVEEIGSQTALQAGVEMGRAVPWGDEVDTPKEAVERAAKENRDAYRNTSQQYPAGRWSIRETTGSSVGGGVGADVPYAPEIAKGATKGAVELATGGQQVTIEDAESASDERAAFRLRW